MSATTRSVGHGIGRQHGHRACLLCGDTNPWSLGLAFEPDGEGGVRTTFEPHERLQGYDGLLHGGVAAALLDSAMTHCLIPPGRAGGDRRFARPLSASRADGQSNRVAGLGDGYSRAALPAESGTDGRWECAGLGAGDVLRSDSGGLCELFRNDSEDGSDVR